MDAIPVFVAYGTSFVSRGSSLQVAELTELIKMALVHKGFSVVSYS